MYLAVPFTLLMGSYVAAAPSIQHAQISVEVSSNMDAYDQIDALHSSEEPVMINGERALKSLPFNFTLTGRHAHGPAALPFGIENSNAPDGFNRGELGFRTEFALRHGKLIVGNRALGYHVARIFPPWSALWSLKSEPRSFLELIAIPRQSGGRPVYFLELEGPDKIFGAFGIEHGNPIFVGPTQQFRPSLLLLTVEPIRKSSEDANAESAEDLL